MREILFKAKRLDNKEWVEGYFTMNPNNDNSYITSNVCGCAHPHRVIPATVCQYIGKCDKFGDKIFENDIVSIDLSAEKFVRARIKYIENTASFLAIYEKNKILWGFADVPTKNIEIIGDIFGYPGLMEE